MNTQVLQPLIEALAVKDDALLGEKSRDELLEELKALA